MIEHLIINSLLCIGFRTANERDKVLYPIVKQPLNKLLSVFPDSVKYFITNPLFGCLVCMSSVWGLGYLYANSLYLDMNWKQIGLYLLALCGTNTVAGMLLCLFDEIKDYFQGLNN